MPHRARTFGLLLLCATAPAGCHSKQKAEKAAAERDAQLEARAHEIAGKMAVEIEGRLRVEEAERRLAERAHEREHVLRTPQDLFEVSGLKLTSRGRGEPVRRITQLTVTNKSTVAVRDIVVRVDFLENDERVAAIPVRLHGALPAGATRTFSAADATLDAAAVEASAAQAEPSVVQTTIDEAPRAAID